LNACNKAFAARQYDTAVTECRAATQIWPGNHLAWYVGGSAHMAKNEWNEARADTEAAVTKRPDQAMYQLYYGIALYEAERARVRDDLAAREHKKPDEVELNPALLKLDAARDALLRAVKLGPALWRAHFYLGRVFRDLDDARHAAEQLAFTIATHPAYRFGYLALGELERQWGYNDDAIAIALLGTKNVPADEAGELWFDAGMAYDANRADDPAIDAFGKAIAAKPDDASAKLARGQIYFRKGDYANAKRDLDEVMASGDAKIAAMRPLAAQMLAQIARRR
jgi:predicted Zn-dependent protease